MGCDMHLHVEVKLDGRWEHYAAPGVERSYALFALMADVRNDRVGSLVPISPPKGLPDDITAMTRFDAERWGEDGHSHSWLSADELVVLDERWNAFLEEQHMDGFKHDLEHSMLHRCYLFGNSFAGFRKYPEDFTRPPKNRITDVRFVFWFDN